MITPYKNAIIPRLDALGELATAIGACINVYRDREDLEKLRGTNTDWFLAGEVRSAGC